MKIGIITFQYADNYGALLQAFALRKYLQDLGHDVQIINYDNSYLYMKNRSIKNRIISKVWKIIALLLGKRKKLEKFKKFRSEILQIDSTVIRNKKQIINYTNAMNFDMYIVGSDQVWNPYITMNDDVYYLSFEKNKRKISYAASFGIDEFPNEYKETFIQNIKQFSSISVREKTAKKILSLMKIENVRVVLDPVFLLNKEIWGKEAITTENEPYILCYYMPGDKKCENLIKKTAKKLNEKYNYRIINIGRKEYKRFLNDGTDIVSASPFEFLGYFKNAKFIVTNSFHGTAFSIIFEKDFFSVVNIENNGEKKLSSRIVDLLNSVELTTNIIKNDNYNIDDIKIDYDKVNEKLSAMIDKSKDYLDASLK